MQALANNKNPLDTESANTIAEAIKDAQFTPWQLILLILGGILLWNLKGLYSIHVAKYETRRKYDRLDKDAKNKVKMAEDKRKSRIARDASTARPRKK